MGKKMKLPFLCQSKSLDSKLSSSSPQWSFPSCGNIKTLSFTAKDDAFRTFNSSFVDVELTPPESFFTSSSRSFSTLFEEDGGEGDPLENIIHGLRSDRLFFEPEQSSSLLLNEPKQEGGEEEEEEQEEKDVIYKESEILSMDSINPCEDFRRSMEEMVEAHGLKDWHGLEELLECYLKINGKSSHGYIVGAFIDLLVNLSFASFDASTSSTSSTTTTTTSYSNYSSPSSPLSLPSSSLTTPCLSSILDHNDDDGHDEDNDEHQNDGHDEDNDEHQNDDHDGDSS
ncbi:transcription repressor OFP13-like [Amaranthus tricolor]|uniref:transcription repressor OFP13-like n=1 Tax=Amaranthus tricolor TaxID=29722 RepID=UPI002582A7E2|nr:transcription repressor OFP13-like [Amaranthus tricolor]